MASLSMHRTLRRIPVLRGLSNRELEDLHLQMVYRFYPAGEVIWRTRGPLRFSGFLESGTIELEYRVDGRSVRKTRLHSGDPLPPRALQAGKLHGTVIATALTDVRIGILPAAKQEAATAPSLGWMHWLWPFMLFLLIAVLARDDLVRITSGLFYLSSTKNENVALQSSHSMSLLQTAQKVEPGAAFAYNEQGYRWFQQKRVSNASAAFEAAVARDPASAPALNNLGITYSAEGNLPLAARYLQQAAGADPNNGIIRYNLGILLMQLQDPLGAIREFREAGFIDPKAASPPLQEAYLYEQMGDYANAEQRARSTIQLNPSLAPAYLLLGLSLYNQGQEAKALPVFTEALVLEPGNRVAAFYQALILGHQKQYDEALPVLYQLLASSTDAAETARILAEMDALYRFKSEWSATGH